MANCEGKTFYDLDISAICPVVISILGFYLFIIIIIIILSYSPAIHADEGIESLPKVPCILHMDSIKGSHRDLKNLVQR